jgi:hypothetical protein
LSPATGTAGGTERQRVTASGAKVDSIRPEQATAFLTRLCEPSAEPIELALGAHEDDGTLIGVAAFGAVRRDHASLMVVVAPERRRLKVGTDLLHLLVVDAERSGIRWFEVTYPVGSAAADALVGTSARSSARRVVGDTVIAVLDTAGYPRATEDMTTTGSS